MKTEVDDIERFEDLLGRYLYGELNAEGKRELLQFILKNKKLVLYIRLPPGSIQFYLIHFPIPSPV